MEQVESSDNNEFSARTQAVIKQARDKTMEWTANIQQCTRSSGRKDCIVITGTGRIKRQDFLRI